jgi:hypothetical protein
MLVNTPGETEQDLLDSAALIEKLRPEIVSFNVFTPYPGCEIFDTWCPDISRADYPLLMESPHMLVSSFPERFRFAAHAVNLEAWVNAATKKYNNILPNIAVYADRRYIRSFICSKRKGVYLCQLVPLFREFVNQKF